MSEFTIPCETFARLNHVAIKHDEYHEPDHPELRCVRIEIRDGYKLAVATNRYVLSCEFLGETVEPDGSVSIANHPELIMQCDTEAQYNGVLTVSVAGEWASATTTFGYQHPKNALVTAPYPDWRKLVPDQFAERSSGSAAFDTEHIVKLGRSSPSGSFMFPRFIDARWPVMVRDLSVDTWFGLFVVGEIARNLEPTFPEWFKK